MYEDDVRVNGRLGATLSLKSFLEAWEEIQ